MLQHKTGATVHWEIFMKGISTNLSQAIKLKPPNIKPHWYFSKLSASHLLIDINNNNY